MASRFAVGLGLAANAAVGMLELAACYCADPGGGPRPFARDVLHGGRPGSVAPRDLDGDIGAEVAAALWDDERLDRSAWHFVRALEIWDPRLLAPVAGHLWIAAETLGPLVEDRCVAEEGAADWRQLAAVWDLTADYDGQLHAKTTNEALIRRVFGGEPRLFKDLREFANGWEHGYRSFGTLREQAKTLVEESAKVIRANLLDLLDLKDRRSLAAPLFDAPVGLWGVGMRLAGTGDGPPEAFAPLAGPIAPGQRSPSLPNWRRRRIGGRPASRSRSAPGPPRCTQKAWSSTSTSPS